MKLKITEAEFTDQVLELAALHGWRRMHARPGRTKNGWRTPLQGEKGFPDLILVRRRTKQVLVAELKVPPNKVKPGSEQDQWLTDFESCGIPAFIWEPGDWDEITRVLEFGP